MKLKSGTVEHLFACLLDPSDSDTPPFYFLTYTKSPEASREYAAPSPVPEVVDCDLISSQGHHAPGVGCVQGGSTGGLRNSGGGARSAAESPHSRTRQAVSVEVTTVVTQWLPHINKASEWAPVVSTSEPRIRLTLGWGGEMHNRLAQLNAMNPFEVKVIMLGMANLSSMDIRPEARLLVGQIAAAGDGFGQPGLDTALVYAAAPGGPEAVLPAWEAAVKVLKGAVPQGKAERRRTRNISAVLHDVA